MPPAAATEWERTGWTLLTIATLAPACAAASAARWPARPAPIIRTSCDGIGRDSITRRYDPAAGFSAWRIWATVTTPRRMPSASTATIPPSRPRPSLRNSCLLYTSDAADDLTRVDL